MHISLAESCLSWGAANNIYRIAHSPNRARTTTEVAGGWAGAIAFSSAFATWFAPDDIDALLDRNGPTEIATGGS